MLEDLAEEVFQRTRMYYFFKEEEAQNKLQEVIQHGEEEN